MDPRGVMGLLHAPSGRVAAGIVSGLQPANLAAGGEIRPAHVTYGGRSGMGRPMLGGEGWLSVL